MNINAIVLFFKCKHQVFVNYFFNLIKNNTNISLVVNFIVVYLHQN